MGWKELDASVNIRNVNTVYAFVVGDVLVVREFRRVFFEYVKVSMVCRVLGVGKRCRLEVLDSDNDSEIGKVVCRRYDRLLGCERIEKRGVN